MFTSVVLYAALLAAFAGAAALVRPPARLGPRGRTHAATVAFAGLATAAVVARLPSPLVRIGASDGSRLDARMPEFHLAERHEVFVQASPSRVWSAIHEVRPGEIRLFLLLMGIRSLNPAPLFGRAEPAGSRPILEVTRTGGFLLLDEDPGREVVLGTCGRFWRLRGRGRCPEVQTADQLLAFTKPGYAKATINFNVLPEGNGTRVVTQTRILATDEGARRRFAAYWRFIYPGSSLIRHGWLDAIKRRAEGGHPERRVARQRPAAPARRQKSSSAFHST